jgi:hypothetical protein
MVDADNIHVATGNRIYFDFYASVGVFTTGLFQSFAVTHSYDRTKNPFDFKHYKINFVALNVDGRQIPIKPLQPDFENAGYIRSYMGLYASTGGHFQSFHMTHSYGRT